MEFPPRLITFITHQIMCVAIRRKNKRFKERITSVVLRIICFTKSFFILNHCQVHCLTAHRTYYDSRLALKVHFIHLNGIKLLHYNLTMPLPNDKICILFTFTSRAADNENRQPTSILIAN